jgi:putative endonuclease
MRNHNYYGYIIASDSGTLYIGMTNDLERRVFEHEQGLLEGFTKKYRCYKLIYYEHYTDVNTAITREKQIKKWSRSKKERLIKSLNPTWRDLHAEWLSDFSTAFSRPLPPSLRSK